MKTFHSSNATAKLNSASYLLATYFLATCLAVLIIFPSVALAQPKELPPALKPWQRWVLWDQDHTNCPRPFNNREQHICFWPSQLTVQARADAAAWQIQVHAFAETWVPLPGDEQHWPFNVRVNNQLIPVVARNSVPSVKLPAGKHDLSGEFAWNEMPQRIAVPKQIGILSLVVNDVEVVAPNWDASGNVWLKRLRVPAAEKDFLAVKVYRVIEDGIPLWLRTEIDLSVAGKSREEQLGAIVPAGWQLSLVESPIPVAVDEQGRMKAQVRAGSWKVQVHAFRNNDLQQFRFASGAQPATATELIGFRAEPGFRIVEFTEIQAVDVTQTTFPERWRGLPVYQWKTDTSFDLVEKMRGMGQQKPKGLSINRHFWLDEDGRGVTYRDRIQGQLQQVWRLDVADGQELGAVSVDGKRQLITANPKSSAHGVELRSHTLNMEALGQTNAVKNLSATGWQTDAEQLHVSMSLPPGWRMLALFGADSVEGDWLTAWSLLDLFLLLIFSLAVYRLWGIKAGIVAFIAFGLSYHEPGAPRITWLFLLMPLALLRVVTEGTGKKLLSAWKCVAIGLLLLNFIPYTAREIQSVIYPQLEQSGVTYRPRHMFVWIGHGYMRSAEVADYAQEMDFQGGVDISMGLDPSGTSAMDVNFSKVRDDNNLKFDPKARVQTGPAEPEWYWNQVHCSWDGPVSSTQQITPILISRTVHRILAVVRLILLCLLVAIILGVRLPQFTRAAAQAATAILLAALLLSSTAAHAQDPLLPVAPAPVTLPAQEIPDQQMLETLRVRLLEPSDAFPQAAEISNVDLSLKEGAISMTAEIHAAIEVAVPLPGRLPSWSPLTVSIDGQPNAVVCRRDDGYLWVIVPQGVHQVVVEGRLAEATEWDWTFVLRPRRMKIDAPGWDVTGLRPNGSPSDQLLFSRREQLIDGASTYDQKNFRAIASVDRRLEIGLIWKVQTTVQRLSAPGKAVSLKVPLLPGESVLSSNTVVKEGLVDVNLGANQMEFSWESELKANNQFAIKAAETDQWVERWYLMTSPVWNVTFSGLSPVFESNDENLIPVWHPWPGEGVELTFKRPDAVSGATTTVQRVQHVTQIGARERTTQLTMQVEASLGSDFIIEFDEQADVSSLTIDGREIPVQRQARQMIVPLQPGKQSVEVHWKSSETLRTVTPIAALKLPVDGSNVTTAMQIPPSRWVLWANGPLRGPAVRFWTILVTAILLAMIMGNLSLSPLRRFEWILLAIGLTQIHVAAAMVVVGWLFLLAWRGKRGPDDMGLVGFNLLQLFLVLLTLITLGIFLVIVGEGLLGNPNMFIMGNESSRTYLNWFEPHVGVDLPQPYIISISVWFYRLLMLIWALWLATALLRWLQSGWNAFSNGGCWKHHETQRGPEPIGDVEVVGK
ncbi:MAG: hypothetical protein ACI9G1_002053 [Pirellulaceae bacterium]|jgi:hypothetical protein